MQEKKCSLMLIYSNFPIPSVEKLVYSLLCTFIENLRIRIIIRIRTIIIINEFFYQRRKKLSFIKLEWWKKKNHFHTHATHYVLLEIMKQDADVKVWCGFQSRENVGSRKESHTVYSLVDFPFDGLSQKGSSKSCGWVLQMTRQVPEC